MKKAQKTYGYYLSRILLLLAAAAFILLLQTVCRASDRQKARAEAGIRLIELASGKTASEAEAVPLSARYGSGPSKADLKGCSSKLEYPNRSSWLDDYETRYVVSTKGGGIFLCYEPGRNSFLTLEDDTEVTVLARQDKNSLVITEYGDIGWCLSSKLFSEEAYSKIGESPSKADLRGCSSKLEYPKNTSWLKEYETRYVVSTKGGGIFLCYKPGEDSFLTLEDDTEVTVLARQGRNSLVITEYGDIGWCLSNKLESEDEDQASSGGKSSSSGPSKADLKGCSSKLEYPKNTSWLKEYETRYVESSKGGGIYLCYKPGKDAFLTLEDDTEVTVLARQGINSLVITEYGDIGWCLSNKLEK